MVNGIYTWKFFFLNIGTLISVRPTMHFSLTDILTSLHTFKKQSLKTVCIEGWGHKYGEKSILTMQEKKKTLS